MTLRHLAVRRRRRAFHAALLASASALTLLAQNPAGARNILAARGGASVVASAAAGAIASAQQGAAASQQSMNALARATHAIQAIQAAQSTARNLAISAPAKAQAGAPDGLATGGLAPDSGIAAPGVANPVTTWIGVGAPTQTISNGETTVTLNQTASHAVLNWQSFNISKNTTVDFNQQGNSDWVALNEIAATGAPSQILGRIKADGQVYLINPNGIIFGGASQVNVNALIASSADVGASQFLGNGIYSTQSGDIYNPSFTNARGAITVDAGAVIATNAPLSVTTGGGFVLLMGAQVLNAGAITTTNGQTELAAGDNFVLTPGFGANASQLSTTRGNVVAPEINPGSGSGTVVNSGLIEATTGDVTLAGHKVKQSGVAFSTSSVATRGTIHLLTDPADTTASVTLAPGSLTEIAPDPNSGLALNGQRAQALSAVTGAPSGPATARIEITSGDLVDFQPNSLTQAPAGQIVVTTGPVTVSQAQSFGRIEVESGAELDVSGLIGVTLPMSANDLLVNIQGFEQRDDPTNRDAKLLNNANVYVDVRQLTLTPAGAGGYATDRYYTPGGLLEVSGELNTVGHSITEWDTVGGAITLQAGALVAQPGSVFNVSGGSIRYQGGYLRQSYLMGADGRIYNVNTAPANISYTGIFNGFVVDHPHWGVSQTFGSPLFPSEIYEPGYTVGRDAGSLILGAPTIIFEGAIDAAVIDGQRQNGARPSTVSDPFLLPQTTVPQHGSLALEGVSFSGAVNDIAALPSDITIGDAIAPVAAGIGAMTAIPASRVNTASFSATALSAADLGGITIDATPAPDSTDGGSQRRATLGRVDLASPISLAPGAALVIQTTGSVSLSSVTADSGSISVNAQTNALAGAGTGAGPYSDIVVAHDALFDLSGLWTNERLDPADLTGGAFIAGGSFSLYSGGALILPAGSVIDVSAGATLLPSGKLNGGRGGNVTLAADIAVQGLNPGYTPPPKERTALRGRILAYGVTGGGSFTLQVPSIEIGNGIAPQSTAQIVLPTAFLQYGFGSYNLIGYGDLTDAKGDAVPGVAVAHGAQLSVAAPVETLAAGSFTAPTGSDPARAMNLLLPPVFTANPYQDKLTQRAGASLSLSEVAQGVAPIASGGVTIGAGSSIAVDPGQSVTIQASDQITIDGTISAPGGKITVVNTGPSNDVANAFGETGGGGYVPGLSIWLGSDSRLDVAGQAVTALDNFGRPYGVAPAGGAITIGSSASPAFVALRPGAVLDASGSSAVVDSPILNGPDLFGAQNLGYPTTLSGDGGSIALASTSGIYLDGKMTAAAGGAGASGGSLSITLDTPAFNLSYAPGGDTANQLPTTIPDAVRTPAEILVEQIYKSSLPADLKPGEDLPNLRHEFAKAVLGANQVTGGGFNQLTLTTTDVVTFQKDVNLAVGRSIVIDAGVIGDADPNSHVTISAPYALLGVAPAPYGQNASGYFSASFFISFPNVFGPAMYPPCLSGAAVCGAGTLKLSADLIDVQGAPAFGGDEPVQLNNGVATADIPGFQDVTLDSAGDIRFLGGHQNNTATISNPGDVTLIAAQIYPVTDATGLIQAGAVYGQDAANAAAVLTIKRYSGSEPAPPLSAGGALTLNAPRIKQGGIVRAPFGSLTFGAEPSLTRSRIDFLPGSITSVSGAGTVQRYGGTVDGVTYAYPGGGVGGLGTPSIQIALEQVVGDAGAVLDLSGGGELTGAGFVSGEGGSVDVLTTPLVNANPTYSFSAASDAVYAIAPGFSGSYAPVDPTQGAAPGIGAQITIPVGAPGLAAGIYTLLPAYDALLPGGFRVEIASANHTLLSGAVATQNGSYAIDVTTGIANTGIAGGLPVVATLTSGKVLRSYSSYNEEDYTAFQIASAAQFGRPRAAIPADAGNLILNFVYATGETPLTALSFAGAVRLDAAPNGQDGALAVVADAPCQCFSVPVEITAPGAAPTPGYVSISAASLDAIEAPTLVLGGGVLGANTGTLNFGNGSGSDAGLVVRSGAVLTGPQIFLIDSSSTGVTLEPGAVVDTIGAGAAPTSAYGDLPFVNGTFGDDGIVAVSNGLIEFLPPRPSSDNGEPVPVVIAAGAKILSQGTFAINTVGSVTLDPGAIYGARSIDLAVQRISLGDTGATPPGDTPPALSLTATVLASLLHGNAAAGAPPLQQLTLTAAGSIDIYGSVFLGSESGAPLSQIVLNAPAIYGAGHGVSTITAGTVYWNGVAAGGVDATPDTPVAGGPGGGEGTLDISANQIVLGYPPVAQPASGLTLTRILLGFDTVNLTASQEITANNSNTLDVYQSANPPDAGGKITYNPAQLNLVTPLVTGAAGSTLAVTTNGAITLSPGGAAPASTQSAALGATVSFTGASIADATAIGLPSGQLTLNTSGGVALGAGAVIDLSGRAVPIFDQTVYSPGGNLIIESTFGSIREDAAATILFGAAKADAGALTATAMAGVVDLAGAVEGAAGAGYTGGGIGIRTGSIVDFSGLNQRLTANGVTGSRSFELGSGDLTVVSADQVQAHAVTISVDNGSLTVDGLIDASGPTPGSINLAAQNNLTLTGNAVLDAHGTGLTVDSYGHPIDASNKAVVGLTTVNGVLTLGGGSTIDVSVTSPQGALLAQQGDVEINVPRTGETSGDANIAASGPVAIKGAASIAVNAFWTYAPTDPNGTIVQDNGAAAPVATTGADAGYVGLDQIDARNTAFINAAWTNINSGGGLKTELAGLMAYRGAFHLRPGVEIKSATPNGDLTVSGDLDLSGFRYGPGVNPRIAGSGEPGSLVLRAGGNLNVLGSITDGFGAPAATPDDNGWSILSGQTLISPVTVTTPVTLAAGSTLSTSSALGYPIAIAGVSINPNAVIPIALTINSDAILPTVWVTTASITLPAGSTYRGAAVIPAGTILPANYDIPTGSILAAGTQLPMSISIGPITIPAGTPLGAFGSVSLTASVTVASGKTIPAGTNIAIGGPQGVLPGNLTLTSAVTLSTQTLFPDMPGLSLDFAITVPGGQYALNTQEPITFGFSSNADLTVVTAFQAKDSIIGPDGTVLFAAGSTVPAATDIPSYSVFGAHTAIPAGALSFSAGFAFIYDTNNGSGPISVPAGTDLSVFSDFFSVGGIALAADQTVPAGDVLPAGTNVQLAPAVIPTRPTLPDGAQGKSWANAPLLPAGAQSWSLSLVGGANLAAADRLDVQPLSVLQAQANPANPAPGGIVLSDGHILQPNGQFTGLSVIRTGTGSLNIVAGGDFSESSTFGVYTAGTQAADVAPQFATGPNGSANNYPEGGGNLLLAAQGDVTAFEYQSEQGVGNWLAWQGGVGPNGDAEATAWSVFFSQFVGIGALGGGNVTVTAGGDAGDIVDPGAGINPALDISVASTGRVSGGAVEETGGGTLTLTVGGALNPGSPEGYNWINANNGTLTDLRGDLTVRAGAIGSIPLAYGSVPGSDPRPADPFTAETVGGSGPSGGPIVVPGDGAARLTTRGDLVLGGAGDAIINNGSSAASLVWFTLWRSGTAIDLFSSGGDLTPAVLQNEDLPNGGASALNDALGGGPRFLYPPTLNAVAASGSLYYSGFLTTGNTLAVGLELAPSPIGQLTFLAANSIYGSADASGLPLPVDISGANPANIPTPFNPAYNNQIGATNVLPNTGGLFAFEPDTPTTDLHGGDPNPALFYAGSGDIVGLLTGEFTTNPSAYVAGKPVRIQAGRDIVDLGVDPESVLSNFGSLVLNDSPTDVSAVIAGRDILYPNIDVAGPGLLLVQAGRNVLLANQGTLESLGPVVDVTPATQQTGAGITVLAGVGANGPDYAGFANAYLNPGDPSQLLLGLSDYGRIVQQNDAELAAWLQQYGFTGASAADAWAYFQTRLSPQQQDVFLRQVFFEQLNSGGLEYNDPASSHFRSYVVGRDAIATLFPTTGANGDPIVYSGDLTLYSGVNPNNNDAIIDGGIRTDFGGAIQTFTPGGVTLTGVEGVSPGPLAGLLTQGQGDIDMYALGSVLLGESRILTTFGGNIVIWSATGDINAGRGAKTTVIYTPPRLTYDAYGDITLAPTVPSTGAGIGTLNPIPSAPRGDINLVAPLGIVDAGEAGIRVSGNFNVAAALVVNAANIQVQGAATGVPVVAGPNIGALNTASNAAGAAIAAATDAARQARQPEADLPSVITVEVIGYGGYTADGLNQTENPNREQERRKKLDQQSSYDPTSPYQVLGLGPLTDAETRSLADETRKRIAPLD